MIPKYARYEYCINKSVEFLLNEKIKSFPYDSDIIIRRHKWSRLKYSQLANDYDLTVQDISQEFNSDDGYSIFNGRNYSIAYNNLQIPKRIYFTKLHEIGHITLNHFIDFDETLLSRNGLTNGSYKVLENEANCFARNVIAPAVLIEALKLTAYKDVSKCFGITYGAARTRMDLLQNDLKYITDENRQKQLKFYSEFINKLYCSRCGFKLKSNNSSYCPICGTKEFLRGDGLMIYNDGYELDDKGRALKCPVCENEQMACDGVYCKICGTYLVNKCTNEGENYGENRCGLIAKGNARFCEYCGAPTTFYMNGLLNDWETNNTFKEIENAKQEAAASLSNDEIPF